MNIAFSPAGDENIASARIRIYSMLPFLSKWGIPFSIGYQPDADVIFVQKRVSSEILESVKVSKENGKVIVYDVDDLGPALDYWAPPKLFHEMISLADVVTTTNYAQQAFIKMKYGISSIEVLPSLIDYYPKFPVKMTIRDRGPLKLLWFGSHSNFGLLEKYIQTLSSLSNVQLCVISSGEGISSFSARFPEIKFIEWSMQGIINDIQNCDLSILMHDGSLFDQLKSNNRMITSITWGLPAIVSRTPDYEKTAREAGIEYALFNDQSDLQTIIEQMRPSEMRSNYLDVAQPKIWNRYRPEIITDRFLEIISQYKSISTKPNSPKKIRSKEKRDFYNDSSLQDSVKDSITPMVSIIIPCDLDARYLIDAVESVLNQVYTNWECIIVTFNGLDFLDQATQHLIEEYPSDKIRVIKSEKAGFSDARNRGVLESRGTFFITLDANDRLAPTFLEEAVPIIQNDPNLGFVYSHIQFFGDRIDLYQLPEFDADSVLYLENTVPYFALVRKHIWKDIGGYNDTYSGYESWDFWISCIQRGFNGHRIPKGLCYFRRNSKRELIDSKINQAQAFASIVVNHPNLYNDKLVSRAKNILLGKRMNGSDRRVLIACSHFWPSIGGLETIAENLGNQLVKLGYSVDIATWARNDRKFFQHKGMRILSLDPVISVNGTSALFMQIHALILSGEYAACIVRADPLNSFIWSFENFTEFSDTRVFIQPIINADGYRQWSQNHIFRERLANIFRQVTAPIALTKNGIEVEYMREEGIEPIYLPNGISIPQALEGFRSRYSIAQNKFLILHVANLYSVKNHIGLLRALKNIPADCQLVMIGHPTGEKDYIKEFYTELQNHPEVIFIPGLTSTEISSAMNEANVVVLASKGEVSPVTILEAMSHHKPWIATPTCGAVHDRAGGIIGELDDFHKILLLLKNNRALCHELGELGYEQIKANYSWSMVIKGWEELIETGNLSRSYDMPPQIMERMIQIRESIAIDMPKVHTSVVSQSDSSAISRMKNDEQEKSVHNLKVKNFQRIEEPLVSVILPTYNRPELITRALQSIVDQTYKKFEVIIVNDAGVSVEESLKPFCGDSRITLINHKKNKGIAAARNTGVFAANGKYIAYLDDDDVFRSNHLEVLVTFLESSGYKAAYTDAYRVYQKLEGENSIVNKDIPYSVDFNFDRLLIRNFIPTLCVVHEKACLEVAGVFDETLITHEDWDLWIRISRSFPFAHLKQVTCEFTNWFDDSSLTRSKREDFLNSMEIIYAKYEKYLKDKPSIYLAQARSLESLREEISELSSSIPVESKVIQRASETDTKVDIVIPIYGQTILVRHCVESLLSTTKDANLILVDDRTPGVEIKRLFSLLEDQPRITLAISKKNQGFISTCKLGASLGTAPYILFLNSDTEAVRPGWLEAMIPTEDDVAIVGAQLLYPPDLPGPLAGTLQHAGVARSADGIPYHPFLGRVADLAEANVPKDVNAVTGACFLVRRSVWEGLGGWDERFGRGVYEDVDLCWRARAKGYRVLYQPKARLYHRESASKAPDGRHTLNEHMLENRSKLLEKWGPLESDEHLFFDQKEMRKWKKANRDVQRARSLLDKHNFKAAMEIMEKVVKYAPDFPDGLVGYAQMLAAQNDHRGAAEYLARSLEYSPANWDVRLRLADEWLVSGNLELAKDELNNLNAVFPNAPEILKRQEAITKSALPGEIQRASENSNHASEKTPPDYVNRASQTLELLLEADDLPAAIEEQAYYLDAELLNLIRTNANVAEADGDVELADGLMNLAAYIEHFIHAAHPQAADTLRAILEAEDPLQAIRQNQSYLDYELLELVSTNIRMANQDGDLELASGLEALEELIRQVMHSNEIQQPEVVSPTAGNGNGKRTPMQMAAVDQHSEAEKSVAHKNGNRRRKKRSGK